MFVKRLFGNRQNLRKGGAKEPARVRTKRTFETAAEDDDEGEDTPFDERPSLNITSSEDSSGDQLGDGEPPGIKLRKCPSFTRTASPDSSEEDRDLLASPTSIKSRQWSCRSEARLEVVRWRSNARADDASAILVPETNDRGYETSRSLLCIGNKQATGQYAPEGPMLSSLTKTAQKKGPGKINRHEIAQILHMKTKGKDQSEATQTASAKQTALAKQVSFDYQQKPIIKSAANSRYSASLPKLRAKPNLCDCSHSHGESSPAEEGSIVDVTRGGKPWSSSHEKSADPKEPKVPDTSQPKQERRGSFKLFGNGWRPSSKSDLSPEVNDEEEWEEDQDYDEELLDFDGEEPESNILGWCLDITCVSIFGEPSSVLDHCGCCGTCDGLASTKKRRSLWFKKNKDKPSPSVARQVRGIGKKGAPRCADEGFGLQSVVKEFCGPVCMDTSICGASASNEIIEQSTGIEVQKNIATGKPKRPSIISFPFRRSNRSGNTK